MRHAAIPLLFSILLLSCSKGEYEDLTTSFEGIVINTNTDEPLSSGQIEIIGSEEGLGPYDAYRKKFQIEPDGTFVIRITTSDISLFQIDLVSLSQECSGPTITQYCTLMEAGQDHRDITIMTAFVEE